MAKWLSDENFKGSIVDGLRHHLSRIDLLRAQDVGLEAADDEAVLEWTAQAGRILLTHDRATMPNFAYSRVAAGKPMPGVFVVTNRMGVGEAIQEILLIETCSDPSEWNDTVVYLPWKAG